MKTIFCFMTMLMLSLSSFAKTSADPKHVDPSEVRKVQRRAFSSTGKNWLEDCQKSHSPTHCLELLAKAPMKDSAVQAWISNCQSSPALAKRCQQLSKSLESVVERQAETAELPAPTKEAHSSDGVH